MGKEEMEREREAFAPTLPLSHRCWFPLIKLYECAIFSVRL
jgi:hypothetical protein